MKRPCASLSAQQQHQLCGPQFQKPENGLLSRLFGSILRSSSKPRAGALPACFAVSSAAPTCQSDPAVKAATFSGGGPATSHCNVSIPVLNYQTNIESKYIFGKELGSGGNGVVQIVINRETGEEFACKSVKKVLPPDASDKKKQGHLDSIRREVLVLTKLKGSLNVVKLEDVYEDDEHVHIVMEMCKGGELWHRIGERHYSERTVASFMRAVLRTLAQCHAQHILHRDIKPGNFMLLSEDERAPVKAIDFGLAAPFDPGQLPRTDLGLEGTPWFMAPETLRGDWYPASDIWAAGVMAFQLLSGRFPFDDKKNSFAPAVTAIWRSVLNDPLDFRQQHWAGISEEAKDFCRLLLNRDVAARPSAKEALKHPWLQGNSAERSVGKRLSQSVVARIQRFASGSLLKRTVLQSIAAELLRHPELLRADREHCATTASGRPIVAAPDAAILKPLLAQLRLDSGGAVVGEEQLGEALAKMGFKLTACEVSRLMEQLDLGGSGGIDRATFAASQMDWRHLQKNHAELWLELAAKAFRSLDTNGSGVLEVDDLLAALRARLPPDELRTALDLALQEAAGPPGVAANGSGGTPQGYCGGGGGNANGIDFPGFMTLLQVGSLDSLDLYDDRISVRSGGSSLDRYNTLLAASTSSAVGTLASAAALGSLRTPDWSRHGAGGIGGSRHGVGGSRHGGGLLSADVSTHSHISDRSDVTAVQDNDRSMHGWGSLHGPGAATGYFQYQQQQHAQGARQAPGGITFKFDGDDDRSDRSTRGVKAAGGSGHGGTAWRFDVGGPKEGPREGPAGATAPGAVTAAVPPPPPPAATATAWRFDVGGERTNSETANASASQELGAAGVAQAGGAFISSAAAGAGGSQAGGKAPYTSVLGRQGGYYDRRMHGSDLYRNVALRALQAAAAAGGGHRSCLDPVAE